MRLTRNELKGLIREVVIEVLTEGLGSGLNESLGRHRVQVPSPKRPNARPRPRPVPRGPNPIEAAIVESSRGDSVLASVLADTARTTLPNMLAGDRTLGGGGISQVEQITSTPEEIFGEETTSKWADLAFAPKRPGQPAFDVDPGVDPAR